MNADQLLGVVALLGAPAVFGLVVWLAGRSGGLRHDNDATPFDPPRPRSGKRVVARRSQQGNRQATSAE